MISRRGRGRVAWLVFVPLAAIAATLALVEKRYDGRAQYAAPAIAGPSEAATAPTGDLRARLVEFAWQFERRGTLGLLPNGCRVEEADGAKDVSVTVQAGSRAQAADALDAFIREFEEFATKIGSVEQSRIDAKRTEIGRRLGELQVLLSRADEQATGVDADAASPLDELVDALSRMNARWTAYAQLRDRLADAQAQRDELAMAPLARSVEIDAAVRASAYAEHTALREDLRHLEIQLLQVRTSVLATGEAGGESLTRLLAAAEEIGELTNSAAAENASPAQRPLLEQTSEKANEYHQQAMLFAQEWTRDLLALKAITADPESAEVLDGYDRLVARVKEFVRTSEDAVGTLQRRVRTFEEASDETASSRMVDAAIVRRFHDLQTAYRSFAEVAGDLYAPDNYLLDAALQSARGLWHRTQATRREVDARLEADALAQATSERHTRIDTLTHELERLRGELIEVVNGIMADTGEAGKIAERVPAHVEAESTSASARLQRDRLREQIADLQTEAQAWAEQARSMMAPANARVIDKSVSEYPTNLEALARTSGLAASLGLLAVLGFFRLADRRRG